jgi:hypothetical protein
MSRQGWSRWLAAPLALVAIALVLSRFQPGAEAGGRTQAPQSAACAGEAPLGKAAGRPGAAGAPRTWWRITEQLDGNGALVGRTLFAGRGAKTTLTMPLATESMARGPVGGLLIVTNDDGRTSEVRLVSIPDGCSWLLHRDMNVVRSAILDPATGSAYAHLLQRETRADLGVFQLVGGDPEAALERVLEPLAPNPELGPIWATELRLDAEGSALAVQSCSELGCLTRVVSLEAFGRPFTVVRGEGQGSMIGFAGDQLVTWDLCAGMPCAIQAWRSGANRPTVLAERGIGAGLTRDGRYLLVVTDASGRAVRIDVAGGQRVVIKGVGAGELPLGAAVTATAGFDVGPNEIALASNGGDAHALAPGAAVVVP